VVRRRLNGVGTYRERNDSCRGPVIFPNTSVTSYALLI
jgi:hypothetical protein